MRAKPATPAQHMIASRPARMPAPETVAANMPASVEASAKPPMEASRARFDPALSARQVRKAPMAAHENKGLSSISPSISMVPAPKAARSPSDRLALRRGKPADQRRSGKLNDALRSWSLLTDEVK